MPEKVRRYLGLVWQKIVNSPIEQRFVAIALILGIIFAVKTPPLWGADETSHYARAYQIAQGNLLSDKMPYPYGGDSYGGKIPKSVHDLIWHTNQDIQQDTNITEYSTHRIDDHSSYAELINTKLGDPTEDYFFPNTAAYSPVAYIPSVIALKIAQIINLTVGQSIFLARVFGLILYVLTVYWVLHVLRKKRFALVLFVVALLPMALYQASMIGVDLLANSLAILLVGFVVKSIVDKTLSRPELLAVALAAVAMPLMKPTYIFLSLLVFAIPAEVVRKAGLARQLLGKVLLIVLAVIALAAWTYATVGVSEEIRRMGIGPRWVLIDPDAQTKFMLTHPHTFAVVFLRSVLLTDTNYISGLFGHFGFLFIQIPMTSMLLSLFALFVSLGFSERVVIERRRLVFITLTLLAGAGSIFATLYITFSNYAQPIIEGVQGRYFMPLLPVLLLVIVAVNTRLKLVLKGNRDWIVNAVTMLCVISLVFAQIKFFYVLFG